VDPRIQERIVQAIGATPEDRLLEIGAGLGALTEGLLKSAGFVTAIERDAKFCKVLADRFQGAANFELIHGDILRQDLNVLSNGNPKSLLIIGNIPFSLTSPILEFLLSQRQWVKRALLTVQKEVAQRIIAPPGIKAYSSISILVQVAFRPSIAFTIPPNAFYPQPEVTSAILRLDPLSEPVVPPDEEEGVLKLARGLFQHRRKTLWNALRYLEGMPKEESLEKALRHTALDPRRRPETLGLEEVARLHRALVIG
jgi:16S rRNA (adenine1518-N6/adenine1519-N6)-dimethyltransferase